MPSATDLERGQSSVASRCVLDAQRERLTALEQKLGRVIPWVFPRDNGKRRARRGRAVRTPAAPPLNQRRETDSPFGGRASPGFSGDRRWHSDCPCSEQPCSKEGQAAGPGGSWRDFRSGRITLCAALPGGRTGRSPTQASQGSGRAGCRIRLVGPRPGAAGPVPYSARARPRTRFA